MDRDLQSIQEVRDLVAKAKAAQAELAGFSQEKIDRICEAIAIEGAKNAERLAKMASEETGFGIWQDKILKNILGSTLTWEAIKNLKTVGIIKEDKEKRLMEVSYYCFISSLHCSWKKCAFWINIY